MITSFPVTVKPLLSIVSPVYRAEKIIPELVKRIENAVLSITDSFEIILVEDGGPDESWSVINKLAKNNSRIIGLKLSRNFGQHYAITCGLDHAKGEWVVVMDCDLQDKPEEIPSLFAKAKEGYDIVLARRYERKDGWSKRFFSATFYRTLGYLTGTEQDETVANFGIYNYRVIEAVNSMRESIRMFPSMVKWVGFNATKLDVEHDIRFEGTSSYNFKRLFNLALDIILAFSDKPLRLLIKSGLLVALVSMGIVIQTLFRWMTGEIVVLGFTSLLISIWFLSGFIISTLGIVGLYVGKTFEGVKKRPIYIVSESTESK